MFLCIKLSENEKKTFKAVLENPSALMNTRSLRRRSDSNLLGLRSDYWHRDNVTEKKPVKAEKFKFRSKVERAQEEE